MFDLLEFGENIWIVDGPPVRDAGVMFTTRMARREACRPVHYGWTLQSPSAASSCCCGLALS
jgi:hypothetical protein